MVDKKQQQREPGETTTIEELKTKIGMAEGIFEALKIVNDWASGLIMTESEFKAEFEKWLKSPINGKPIPKKGDER